MAIMQDIKLLWIDDNHSPHFELLQHLQDEHFAVTVCNGGFDALGELANTGADIIVASTSLPDISGYQLSSFLKSNERTGLLPVILIGGQATAEDEFWQLAALADAVFSLDQSSKSPETISARARELVAQAKTNGWKSNTAKNKLISSRPLATKDLINSYGGLLDDLLIERLVAKLVRQLSRLKDHRKNFAGAYFQAIEQDFRADVIGVAVINSENPWAVFKVAPGLSKGAFNQLIAKISKQFGKGKDLAVEHQGELSENGKTLGEIEILPVVIDQSDQGALIFGSYQKKAFSAAARAFMSQLQLQMGSIVQLLLAKQEIEVLQVREANRAAIDPLTGLYNLEFLVGFLQQQLLFSFRQRLAVGMVIIDIDDFAKVNNEFSQETGDIVMTTLANRLVKITRSSDLIARYGPDEFAVVLPNTDVNGVRILAEKVRAEVEQMGFVKGAGRKNPHITVSVGCSTFNMEDQNPETILRDAKIALQQAKEAGKNRVAMYSPV